MSKWQKKWEQQLDYLEDLKVTRLLKKGRNRVIQMFSGRTVMIILLLLLEIGLLFSVFSKLEQYLPIFYGSAILFTACMLFYVLNTRSNPSLKLSWCIVIALFPFFGAVLYWIIHTDIGHKVVQRIDQENMKESAPFVLDQTELMERLKEEEPALYNVARYTTKFCGCPVYDNTHTVYYGDIQTALENILKEIDRAEHFIFLEYFIVREGYMWGMILHQLIEKAKAGVDVRLLYDGTCSFGSLPYNYPKKLEKHGIQCRVFSPIRPFISTHYNNRDHRKILVVDGKVGFTGGFNLSDEYINITQPHGRWKDAGIKLTGDGVRSLTMMFLQVWNSTGRPSPYAPYLLEPHRTMIPSKGYVIPYGDTPLDQENVGEMIYLDILNRAKEYVYIMTPYLILDNEMVTALTFAAKRGIDVRLILPHIPDKKYVYILAQSHYPQLLAAGVRIFEYTPGFVHAKVFLSDDNCASVGTINLDYRSLYLHFECSAYLYKTEAIPQIKRDFFDTLGECQEITMEDTKKRDLLSRLATALLKVIAPLM